MMVVNRAQHFSSRQAGKPVLLALLALATASLGAQGPNPTSAANPFFGSVTLHGASDETLKLSLDEAIGLGLKNNLGLKEAENGEKLLQGEKNDALQEFLPTIVLSGSTGVYQHNLAALGFGPSVIDQISPSCFRRKLPAGFSFITRDDLTQGQILFSETLFSGPVIAAYKGAGAAERAAHFAKMSARGEVVQQVATAYLHAIAAASEVDNAKALEAEDQVLLNQAHDAHEAGAAANLDELRARVQLQAQQQALILAENDLEKDLILLKREIGVDSGPEDRPHRSRSLQRTGRRNSRRGSRGRLQEPPGLPEPAEPGRRVQGHPHRLSQPAPAHPQLRRLLRHRHGHRRRHPWQLRGPGHAQRPALPRGQAARRCGSRAGADGRHERPTRRPARPHRPAGALGAAGCGRCRASWSKVARSNVDLATRALSDETDRVNAGVDDNLPLVTAQATLASPQSNLVESLYQYNVSKLALARAAGVLETQYREYLGR